MSMIAPVFGFTPSPMGVGDVLGNAFKTFRARARMMIVLTLLPILIIFGLTLAGITGFWLLSGRALITLGTAQYLGPMGILNRLFAGLAVATTMFLVAIVVGGAYQIVCNGRISLAAIDAFSGRPTSDESLKASTPGLLGRALGMIGIFVVGYLVLMIVLGMIVGLVVGGSAMLVGLGENSFTSGAATTGLGFATIYVALIVGSLYVGTKIIYAIPIMAVEGVGPWEAFRRSWRLTTGSFWRTLGYLLISQLIVQLVVSVVTTVAYVIFSLFLLGGTATIRPGETPTAFIILGILGTAIMLLVIFASTLLTNPYMASYIAMMYVDQRNRWFIPVAPAGPQQWGSGGAAPLYPQQPYPYHPGTGTGQPPSGPYQPPAGGMPPGPVPPGNPRNPSPHDKPQPGSYGTPPPGSYGNPPPGSYGTPPPDSYGTTSPGSQGTPPPGAW